MSSAIDDLLSLYPNLLETDISLYAMSGMPCTSLGDSFIAHLILPECNLLNL